MLNTRETDYALRMLRALNSDVPTPLGKLCKEHQIPQQFAYKISPSLVEAGWIEMVRGPRGGCRLKTNLEEKTLHDLFQLLGRENDLSPCLDPDYVCPWKVDHECKCGFNEEFIRLQSILTKELSRKSIAELACVQKGIPT